MFIHLSHWAGDSTSAYHWQWGSGKSMTTWWWWCCTCEHLTLLFPQSSYLSSSQARISDRPVHSEQIGNMSLACLVPCKSHYPLETACSQFASLQCNQCSQMETALKFTFSNLSFIFLFWCFLSGFPVVLASLGLPRLHLSRLCFPQAYGSLSILTCKGISAMGWLSLEH